MKLRKQLCVYLLICISCVLSLGAQADSLIIPASIPHATPIDIRKYESKASAQVVVVKSDVVDGTLVGFVGQSDNCYEIGSIRADKSINDITVETASKAFSSESRKYGYARYDPDLSVFESKIGTDPDFGIAITVLDMRYKLCRTWDMLGRVTVFGRAYVKAKVELKYAKNQIIVYAKEVAASSDLDYGNRISLSFFFPLLQRELIDQVLADPDFVGAYLYPENTAAAAGAEIAHEKK